MSRDVWGAEHPPTSHTLHLPLGCTDGVAFICWGFWFLIRKFNILQEGLAMLFSLQAVSVRCRFPGKRVNGKKGSGFG